MKKLKEDLIKISKKLDEYKTSNVSLEDLLKLGRNLNELGNKINYIKHSVEERDKVKLFV